MEIHTGWPIQNHNEAAMSGLSQGQSTEMDGALEIPYYLIGRAHIIWIIPSKSCHYNQKYKTWLHSKNNDKKTNIIITRYFIFKKLYVLSDFYNWSDQYVWLRKSYF